MRLVVLVVVDLHGQLVDVRLERAVVIGEGGTNVYENRSLVGFDTETLTAEGTCPPRAGPDIQAPEKSAAETRLLRPKPESPGQLSRYARHHSGSGFRGRDRRDYIRIHGEVKGIVKWIKDSYP